VLRELTNWAFNFKQINNMKLKIKSLFVSVLIFAAGVQVMMAQNTQQAMAYLDAEQFTKAEGILTKQVAEAPTGENLFALGYYFIKRGNLDKAKETFDKGLAADPKNPINNIGNAMVLLGNKKYPQAKAMIDAALASTKMKNVDILYRAAEAYTLFDHTNDPAEAVRLIDMIPLVKKSVPLAEYQIVKGDAYLLKNDGGPAVSAYEQAFMLNPKSAKSQMLIGKVFKRGKNYKFSQEGYNRAIQIDSTYSPAYREFGELWLLARNYKNASNNYDKYLRMTEPTCENKLRYVKMAFLAKNYEGARRVQKEVEECAKNNAELQKDTDIPRMKGYMLFEEGKYTESISFLKDLLIKLPADKVLLSDKAVLGKSYQKAGEDSLALQLFNEVAPLDTNDNYYTNIHDIQYKAKKYDAAAAATNAGISWRNDRKERIPSNDYLTLTRDYYFSAVSIPYTSTSTKEDTLRKIDLAQKADAAIVKMMELNATYIMAHLWRARANAVIDADKTKGLAVPFYEKYIELALPEKEKNKRELVECYLNLGLNYLAYAPVKDDVKGKDYFNKVKELDPENVTVKKYEEAMAPPATVPVVPPAAGTTKTPPKASAKPKTK
jgi:tetratricopeptide (TPR) repeat protein